jgi:hypothetical protein
MRSINYAIRGAMLGGMVLALSSSPALASGENKMENENPKVEIVKVEKDKVEKVMLGEKKVEDKLGDLRIHRIDLLDEDILGEGILEDLLGEED